MQLLSQVQGADKTARIQWNRHYNQWEVHYGIAIVYQGPLSACQDYCHMRGYRVVNSLGIEREAVSLLSVN